MHLMVFFACDTLFSAAERVRDLRLRKRNALADSGPTHVNPHLLTPANVIALIISQLHDSHNILPISVQHLPYELIHCCHQTHLATIAH
jgi:hypothetical protein